MRLGIPVADRTAGPFCAIGILTRCWSARSWGKGQWVQTSLLQAQIFMLDFQAARWLMEKEVAKQAGNNHPTSIPTCVFRTSDGYINIAKTDGRIWERCAQAIGAPKLCANPDYATAPARSKNRDALNAAIEKRSRPRPGSAGSTRPACPAARSTRSTRCSRTRRSSISATPRTCRTTRTATFA
ncbi:crotonobetainyl-CoA:carnitine CoA-transferase CaiB-like acyl-CoA transferase [Bradyrhizobium sp. CIR18]|nr:crotonobetainyl-CoA:carnitine CoA-transferase CaiB-like acyl-CoA transferase [Bradyrhizobium sp. CIR18]